MNFVCSAEPQTQKVNQRSLGNCSALLSWLPFVLFYTLIANLPFWAASRWLGIFRNGWFCMDYVLLGLIALVAPRILTAVLLACAIAVDIMTGVCQTYFISFTQCLLNTGAIRQFSGLRVLAVCTIVLLTLLAAGVTALFPLATIRRNYRKPAAACLILFATVTLAADEITFLRRHGGIANVLHPKTEQPDTITNGFFTELRLSRLPTYRVIRIEIAFAPRTNKMRSTVSNCPDATRRHLRTSKLPQPRQAWCGV